MLALNRTNTSLFGRWWWTVDRVMLGLLATLMLTGVWLVLAGSPAVAERIGLPGLHFFYRQLIFLSVAVLIILSSSMLSVQWIVRLSIGGLLLNFLLMIIVLFVGEEVKGASRWIPIFGFTLQPSEFMKPCFVVVTAWLLAERLRQPDFPGYRWSMGLLVVAIGLLLLQPDFGMVCTVLAVWGAILFFSGLPLYWFILFGAVGVGGFVLAYLSFSHVAERVNNFMDPAAAGNYQVQKSLEAFRNGGWFGVGPGEGVVKRHLPDSHTDFIFAVAGEEMGILFCIGIVTVMVGIIMRGLWRVRQEKDFFIMLACAGLLMLFGIQSFINIGVTLNLLPTKGMTLPLISYGGSSTLAYALCIGMLLALTRKRYGA